MIDFGILNRIVTPITPHHCVVERGGQHQPFRKDGSTFQHIMDSWQNEGFTFGRRKTKQTNQLSTKALISLLRHREAQKNEAKIEGKWRMMWRNGQTNNQTFQVGRVCSDRLLYWALLSPRELQNSMLYPLGGRPHCNDSCWIHVGLLKWCVEKKKQALPKHLEL